MHRCIERFLRYVKIDTRSCESSDETPSSKGQHVLAELLASELEEMGARDVFYDRAHCYVYATVPASAGTRRTPPEASARDAGMQDAPADEQRARPPVLGLIAHLDTSEEVSGKDVRARIVERYDGGDIVLHPAHGITLSPKEFPDLARHVGEDLIVTDGTTLLGADDKAGIAEIMTAAQYFLSHPEAKRPELRICFTPDEEVGEGTRFFDLKRFGADFAYTVDGSRLGELEYENFNAAEAELIIHGRSVHPGQAKGRMRNATLIAYEFQSMLPVNENPMYTEGREGFYHLTMMRGTCDIAVVYYIIREHDRALFERRKERFQAIVDYLNGKYGAGVIEATVEDVYYNMLDRILPHMHLIENARRAMRDMGITPLEAPIRGGTDGARLSYMGLPCPNLGTGGYNYHSRYEYASVQEMEQCAELLIRLCGSYAGFRVTPSGD